MPADTLLTAIRAHLKLPPTHQVLMEPVQKGASGRTVIRLQPEGYPTFIGVHYTLDRADNANFMPVARFLKKSGLKVPEVLYDNPARRVALVEDLGNEELMTLKDKPFAERKKHYLSIFKQLDKLLYTRPPKDFELQPKFDEAMYGWEQGYFLDYYVSGILGREIESLRDDPALLALRKGLGASAPHLVHRDLQSQNVMIFKDEAYLLDFQGMRMGRQEYDLASLLYDPYMDLSSEEREELLDGWEDITEERPIETVLRDCAAQRLMQALGAFGNIVTQQQNDWYVPRMEIASRLLREVVKESPLEESIRRALGEE